LLLSRSSVIPKSSRTLRIRRSSTASETGNLDVSEASPVLAIDENAGSRDTALGGYDGDDADYYRRRSELLQKILDKTRENESLAGDKLLVLQDVVQQQSRRLEREAQRQKELQDSNVFEKRNKLEEQEAAASAAVAATAERAAAEQVRTDHLQKRVDELQTNLTTAEERAARLQIALEKVEHSLAKRKGEMQHQQLYYQSQIEELRRSADSAELEAEKAREMLSSQRLLLDQSKQQREQEVQTQLLQAEERFNTSLAVARSKFEAKLQETRGKLHESEREVSDLKERDAQRHVAEWEERLLIASASVRASEQREDELLATVDQLRSVATTRNDTIRHLQAKVEELRSQIDVLETSKVDDVSALALPSTSREDAAKIEDLEEQVQNLKHAHAAQLRSQRKQFEKEVNELRERMELERESSVVLPTAAVRSTTARTSDPPTPPGAARRLWQRVKRPFQKR
jgi:hypothetical protein